MTIRQPLELRVRRLAGRSLSGLRNAPYLRRWLVLGVAIGAIAGLGSALFLAMLQGATKLILGLVGGYTPATPSGEGAIHAASGFARPWAIPLVVTAGMIVTALIIARFAPEAAGHGTDAAIDAVHHNPKGLRGRAAAVKMVASAITIGSGGSGGREGPTAQISATFGSVLSRTLNLSPADARIAVSSGIAAGIGAIFRAPLGGALLGVELPYRDDVETKALVPSLVASIVAFAVFGSFFGFEPIFGDQGSYHFSHVVDLAFFAVLGIASGLVGRAYIFTFHRLRVLIRDLKLPFYVKTVIAGLLVGGIGLAIPGVLGTGYGEVQQVMSTRVVLGMPIWVVILLPLAKIVATSLTIGSGGSGGIFGPGMVIGGVGGAAVWRLLELTSLPIPDSPVPFVIVGMISCFGSIAHAPLAVMLMVAEMTGNLSLLAPAMVSLALAVLVVGDRTIYRSQLRNRADLPAHRLAFGLPLAAAVSIDGVMTPPRVTLSADTTVADTAARLAAAGVPGAPVVDAEGKFLGSLGTARAQQLAAEGSEQTAGKLADPQAMVLSADARLDEAIDAVVTSRAGWVPVLDSSMTVVGVIAVSDLVRGYRLGLRHAIRRMAISAEKTSFVERRVAAGARADGAAIGDLGLPHPTIIMSILRGTDLVLANGSTKLQAGDRLSILAGPGTDAALDAVFGPSDQ